MQSKGNGQIGRPIAGARADEVFEAPGVGAFQCGDDIV